MKASEALAIARQNLQGPAIEPFLRDIHARIAAAAHKGDFSIMNPFHGLNPTPNFEQEKALKARLAADGYEWKDHPDPDRGHPCSRPYTTLSWRP